MTTRIPGPGPRPTSTPPQDGGPTPPRPGPAPAADGERQGGLGGLFGGLGQRLGSAVDGLKDQFVPKLSDQERAALGEVKRLLPELAGADGRFNRGDVKAIKDALQSDTEGLRSVIHPGIDQEFAQRRQESQYVRGPLGNLRRRRLPRPGTGPLAQSLAHKAADAALDGRQGPLASAARKKIHEESGRRIQGELDKALDQMGVDPATAGTPDSRPRQLGIGQLEAFGEHAKVLDTLRERMIQQYGVEVQFPQGITVDAIQHVLDGKLGVPPGGKLVAAPKK